MRLRLRIKSINKNTVIPISYEYYLSSAIYRWIELSSPEFSKILHDVGYQSKKSNSVNDLHLPLKAFKHFCFSQLFPSQSFVKDEQIHINDGSIIWYIGIPVEETLKHLVIGFFERQKFFIGSEENKFAIEQIEALPEPTFINLMKFKTLSPITASVPINKNGKLIARYLMADDPDLSDVLRENLLSRYESLYGKKLENKEFICEVDYDYMNRRGGAHRVSKLVTIKQNTPEETKVRGFRCPVTLKGNPELIKFAYESGLGEKGSMGFGMLDVI